MIDCCDKCATYDGGVMHPPIGCHNNNCDCHLQKASNYMQTEQEKLKEKRCESNDLIYTSYPPQNKCKNCGQFWFCKDASPICLKPLSDIKQRIKDL